MRPRYLAELDQAAEKLKQGLEERNAASLALATAKNDIERRAALVRHERAYRQLEELKKEFMQAATHLSA